MNPAAFCLCSTHSGSGKTTLAAGLLRAITQRGLVAQGFKCGPDYVDPTFHAQASGRSVRNLDTWMMGREGVQRLFAKHTSTVHVAVIEGVMGLLDGRLVPPGEPDGSTLDLAAALHVPLVLAVSAKGMGSSIAALVFGCTQFALARGVQVVGVIANNVGSARHSAIIKDALALHNLPPLLGALPRNPAWTLPERQLGLVPAHELTGEPLLNSLAEAVEAHVDINTLLALSTVPLSRPECESVQPRSFKRLAVARDEAFCFFYEENDEALRRKGWELIPFSPLHDTALPDADALYLCGGYPEVFASQLAANTAMLAAVRDHAAAGREIWAECGGYMYLCRELQCAEGTFALCNVLNATAHMGGQLRSLGYREVSVELPFGLSAKQTLARGHEFHWSHIEHHAPHAPLYADLPEAGCVLGNVRAGYVHLYWGNESESNYLVDPPTIQISGVLLLNGPSSAGKTSLAKALQARLHQENIESLVLSVDALLCGSLATSLNTAEKVLAPAFHAAVAEVARCGKFVIVDHVIGEDSHWLADLQTRLGPIQLTGVQVRCDPAELVRRESTRTDRPADAAHALRQHAHIHIPLPNELCVDTSTDLPDACAVRILRQFRSIQKR